MTKYLHDMPFSSQPATDAYRANWDVIFGKKEPTPALVALMAKPALLSTEVSTAWGNINAPEKPCPCESACAFEECHGKVESDPADV